MSLTRKNNIKVGAPPILGPMDFMGLENKLILIEHDDNLNGLKYLEKCEGQKVVYTQDHNQYFDMSDGVNIAIAQCDSISRVAKYIKKFKDSSVKWHIVHRPDLMDVRIHPRLRGANIKGQLSMVAAPKILQGSNIVILSGQCEYATRCISDIFFDLKAP